MAHHSHLHVSVSGSKIDAVMDGVLYDTEVVHYPDFDENCETDMLFGYDDTQIIPDSDDDMMDSNDSKGHSSRGVSFIERLAAELCKVESRANPLCNNLDQDNIDNDACGDERHTLCLAEGTIVCHGDEVTPMVVQTDRRATELGLEDTKMPMGEDPDTTKPISWDLKFDGDVNPMSTDSIVGNKSKPSQMKKREVRFVYTRKKNRLRKPKDNGADDMKSLTAHSNENGGLSYVESQEPEDLSTALLFVDQYVSVNAMPMLPSPVTAVRKILNSPPALSAKGAQSLLKQTGAKCAMDKAEIFEWNDIIDGDGGYIPSENSDVRQLDFRDKTYNHTYVRKSPSVNTSLLNEQGNGKEGTEESPLLKTESDTIPEDSEHVYDVGIGTQIAVEAIQALSSAFSVDCSEMDHKKQMHVGTLSFPKKTRSTCRHTTGPKNTRRTYCFDHLDDIMQNSKHTARRNSGKLAAAKDGVGRSSVDSDKMKVKNESEVYRAKEMDFCNENMNGSLIVDNFPLCRLKKKRKVKKNHPASANFKSSSLCDMHEDHVSNPMKKRVADMNSGPYNKQKDLVISNMLEVSAKKTDISKDFSAASLNISEMKLNDEDRNYLGKRSEQLDNCHFNIGSEGKTGRDASSDARNTIASSECYLAGSTNRCLGDYPRGKRACRSILDHSDRYRGYPSAEVGLKKKRRSTIYISPCLLSSKKSEANLRRHPLGELKKNTLPEQPTDSTITVQISNLDGTGRKADENLNPYDAVFPSCQASKCEVDSMSLVDGYGEYQDMKKPSTPLTRELLRLGFRGSMPDFTSKTSRQRKTMANIRVLLSQNLDESTRKRQIKIMMRFGVPISSCPSIATHFVTDRFARTRNMLEFIAQGKPVVTHQWLESCDQAGFYIDDRDYIVRDERKEQELGFRLPTSLERARHHPLLRGYKIFITPNAKPGKEILASLVKAVHGEVVNVVMDSELGNMLILSCDEDQAYCNPLIQRGIAAYSSELLLNGIIIQKLEFERHRLVIDQREET